MPRIRKLTLSCPTSSLEEFTRLADLAQEIGFTHVAVSHLPKARWQVRIDPSDPYPNWNMRYPAILTTAVPEPLREWVSHDHGQRCMEILAGRGAILRRRELKAAFFGTEPMWLPEAAFEKHPEWRGPRSDYPGRSPKPYHAVCVDHPQVLAMYRQATAEICRAAPVELFEFKANDAGTGFCWSETLYQGANGPEACKHRTYTERFVDFLSAIQRGAKDEGLFAQVEVNIRTTPKESEATWPQLKEGQVIANINHLGKLSRVSAGFCTYHGRGTGKSATGPGKNTMCATFGNYAYGSHTTPVMDVPQPLLYAEQLERVFEQRETDGLIYIPSVHCGELFDLSKEYSHGRAPGVASQREAVLAVARRRVGNAAAPLLLEAWGRIQRAVGDGLSKIQYGGPLFMMGTVSQRWLIRPLVPFPLELKPAEKDYYRKFQFTARSEAQAADLMDLQGVSLIRRKGMTWDAANNNEALETEVAVKLLKGSIAELEAARTALRRARAVAQDAAAGLETETLELRLAALICVIHNAICTAKYQDFLEGCATPHGNAREKSGGVPEEVREIINADLANTRELIELLESTAIPVLEMAATPSEEDVFTLGPDLVGQLRNKIRITQAHFEDHRRL